MLLGKVERILKEPDLTIGNLEGTLTSRGSSKCGAGSSDCYAFRSPPSYATAARRAGFDVMNLANNHAFDFGKVGLADTRAALDGVGHRVHRRAGPGHGARGGRRARRRRRASRRTSGRRRSTTRPRSRSSCRRPTRAPTSSSSPSTAARRAATSSTCRTARESQFGENRGNLRAFARAAIDAGADLVVGSGPHVVRGMQFYKGRLIAYSAGNFVGWEVFSLSGPLSVSYILEVTLKPDGTWVSGKMLATKLVDPGYADTDASGAAITACATSRRPTSASPRRASATTARSCRRARAT